MINFPIPHTARYVCTGNIFKATYNIPGWSAYSFNTPANTNQKVIDLQKNSVYFLERITVGGNISEEIFNNSINDIPLLVLKYKQTGSIVYEKPIPILGYYQNQEISTFIKSEITNDELLMSFNPVLNQVLDTIGLDEMRIGISFSFFVIDNNEYNAVIRDTVDKNYSRRLNS